MKCAECVCWWTNEGENYPSCHADPNWPAPCEYDDDEVIVDDSYDPGLEPDWEEDEDPFHENDPYVVTNPMAFY